MFPFILELSWPSQSNSHGNLPPTYLSINLSIDLINIYLATNLFQPCINQSVQSIPLLEGRGGDINIPIIPRSKYKLEYRGKLNKAKNATSKKAFIKLRVQSLSCFEIFATWQQNNLRT